MMENGRLSYLTEARLHFPFEFAHRHESRNSFESIKAWYVAGSVITSPFIIINVHLRGVRNRQVSRRTDWVQPQRPGF